MIGAIHNVSLFSIRQKGRVQRGHYATPSAYEKNSQNLYLLYHFSAYCKQGLIHYYNTLKSLKPPIYLYLVTLQHDFFNQAVQDCPLLLWDGVIFRLPVRRDTNISAHVKPTKTERLFWVFNFTICYLLVAFATKCRRMQ